MKFRTISKLSLGQLWSFFSHPAIIPVWLRSFRSGTFVEIVQSLADASPAEIERYRREFLGNHIFFTDVNKRFVQYRGKRMNFEGWPELLYVITRIAKPEIVVETGVFDGRSSAVFLQALHDNNKGKLISIDFPAVEAVQESTHRMKDTVLPPGCKPGWLVPDSLRARYELVLGDSKIFLPRVLERTGKVDIFLHDSLHTFEHQKFEYEAAWPYLADGGLVLSDDVLWTPAFQQFAAKYGRPYHVFQGLGLLKK